MSIHCRVDIGGCKPLFFSSRELFGEFGLDKSGIPGFGNYQHLLFSFRAKWNNYFIQIPDVEATHNNSPVDPTSPLHIKSSDILSFQEFSIQFLLTSPGTEVITCSAFSRNPLKSISTPDENTPKLSVQVAGCSRSFPVLPDSEFTIGSAFDDTIRLSLPGIEEAHCKFSRAQKSVMLSPGNGEIRLGQSQLKDSVHLHRNSRITLAPSGLQVEFAFPEKKENQSSVVHQYKAIPASRSYISEELVSSRVAA